MGSIFHSPSLAAPLGKGCSYNRVNKDEDTKTCALVRHLPISIPFLVVFLILTTNNILPPFFVLKIPFNTQPHEHKYLLLQNEVNTLSKIARWLSPYPVIRWTCCIYPISPRKKLRFLRVIFGMLLITFHKSMKLMTIFQTRLILLIQKKCSN